MGCISQNLAFIEIILAMPRVPKKGTLLLVPHGLSASILNLIAVMIPLGGNIFRRGCIGQSSPHPPIQSFMQAVSMEASLSWLVFLKKLNAFLFIRLHFSGVISFHFTHTTCKRHNVTLTSMAHELVVLLKENVSINCFYVSLGLISTSTYQRRDGCVFLAGF